MIQHDVQELTERVKELERSNRSLVEQLTRLTKLVVRLTLEINEIAHKGEI